MMAESSIRSLIAEFTKEATSKVHHSHNKFEAASSSDPNIAV